MINADFSIENAMILTMNRKHEILKNATLIISGNKIIDLGNNTDLLSKYAVNERIDATGKLLMPGLINTHTHAAMTIYRGMADDLPLQTWLKDYIFPIEKKYTSSKSVAVGTQLAIAEMLRSGTTTFADMYYFCDQVAQVAKNAGIRAVVGQGILDFQTPDAPNADQAFRNLELLIEKWKGDNIISFAVGPHAPYTCPPEILKKAVSFSDRLAVPLFIHLAETKWEYEYFLEKEKQTPTEYLHKYGILKPETVAAHSIYLSDADIELLAKTNCSVAHNPECNMKLASGVAPFSKFIKVGIKIGLGTDGCASNNNLNMFEEARTAAYLHKFSENDPTVATAKQLVEIITIGGAEVLGIQDITGSLEVGKRADILIIDLNRPHLKPLYNIYSQIVYSLTGSEVESIFVDGKKIIQNYNLLTIDENNLFEAVNEISNQIEADLTMNSNSF